MAQQDVIQNVLIETKVSGADEAKAKLTGLTQAQGQVAEAAKAMEAAQARVGERYRTTSGDFDKWRAKHDQVFRAEQAYARDESMAKRYLANGRAIGEVNRVLEQSRSRLDAVKAKYGEVAQANDNMAKSHQLAGHQIQNMRAQLLDVATSLQGGMNPFTVMMQQGPQIAQIFGPGQGGVLGIFRGIGQAIPKGVAIGGGILGAGLLAAKGYDLAQEQGLDARRSLLGPGIRSGLSAQELDAAGRGGTRYGLSIWQGQDVANSLASGGVGIEGIRKAQAVAKDLSISLKQSLGDTVDMLSKAADDPAKFYERVSSAIGTTDAATTSYIKSLADQQDKTKAMTVALDAISGGLLKYNTEAKTSTRLGDGLKRFFTDTAQGIVDSIDGVTNASRTLEQKSKSAADIVAENEKRKREAIEATTKVMKSQADASLIAGTIDNALARMDPLSQAVAVAQRAVGGGPALTKQERDARRGEAPQIKAARDENDAQIALQVTQRNSIEIRKALIEQGRVSALTIENEIASIGRSSQEIDKNRFATQALIAASQGGKKVSEEVRAEIDKQADSYARLTENLRRTQLADQIRFERSQLGRDAGDQAIASQLRPYGGIDRNPEAADALRLTQNLAELKSTLSTGITGFITAIRSGTKPAEALAQQAGQIADRMIAKTVDQALSSAMGWGMGQLGLDKVGLPGLGSTTGTMNVTAASVIVNGGIGAGADGLIGSAAKAIGGRGSPEISSSSVSLPGVDPWPVSKVTSSSLEPSLLERMGFGLISRGNRSGIESGSLDPASDYGSRLMQGLETKASAMASAGDGLTAAMQNTASGVGTAGGDLVSAVANVGSKLLDRLPSGLGSLMGNPAPGYAGGGVCGTPDGFGEVLA